MTTKPTLNWKQQEKGWWTAWAMLGSGRDYIAVCNESDGKWHSYVGKDTLQTAPGFKTMNLAMLDAEARVKALLNL